MIFDGITLGLPGALAVFTVSAAVVWLAGARIAYVADELSDRRRLSKSIVGLLLLATATSLPEIATTVSAATRQNQALVLNNLYGGVALQTAILAVADFWARGAITNYPRRMNHALEATLLIGLLVLSATVIVFGEPVSVGGVGLGSVAIALCYVAIIVFLRRQDPDGDWLPVELPDTPSGAQDSLVRPDTKATDGALVLQGLACAAAIFLFGLALVMSAEMISTATGLASGFVGATFLAAATSLPELTTSIAAVRLGAYTLAISNIFGSNLIMLVLVLPADILFRGKPLLAETGPISVLALLVGTLVTCIYLVGLIARRKPIIGPFGLDSVLVLILFAASNVLYFIVS